MNDTDMKTLSLILTIFLPGMTSCFAQDNVKERVETINAFIHDLRTDASNPDLFERYLLSRGAFGNETTAQAANGWTDMLRKLFKASTVDEIEVYKYSDRPEKGRKLKSVDDPDSHVVEYVPLEFELHRKDDSIVPIETVDLYVVAIRNEKVFILFDHANKMTTWFGLKWGQKIELTEF